MIERLLCRQQQKFPPTAVVLLTLVLVFCRSLGNAVYINEDGISLIAKRSAEIIQSGRIEDTFQNFIESSVLCDDVTCKETYEEADYPYKAIAEAVNASHNVEDVKQLNIFRTSFPHFANRIPPVSSYPGIPGPYDIGVKNAVDGLDELHSRCKAARKRYYPLKGRGTNGKQYYIVNVEGFRQEADIVVCHENGSSCDKEGAAQTFHARRCKQTFGEIALSTFSVDDNITPQTQSINTFTIPTGCQCELTRVTT